MRRIVVALAGLGLLLAAGIALAQPASAHAMVVGSQPTAGADLAAAPASVEISFDEPVGIDGVGYLHVVDEVQPTAGWSFAEKTATLVKPIVTDDGDVTQAVSEIDWRATSAGVGAGEFGSFTVIAGQLPDAESLTFKAIQTYSNGTKVSWIEVPAAGSTANPEHPAPVLGLTPAAPATSTGSTNRSSTDTTLAVAALVVACLAACVALAAYQRSRRNA